MEGILWKTRLSCLYAVSLTDEDLLEENFPEVILPIGSLAEVILPVKSLAEVILPDVSLPEGFALFKCVIGDSPVQKN